MKKHTSLILFLMAISLMGNAQALVHYWNFNSADLATAKIPTVSLTNPAASITVVPGTTGTQTKEEISTGQNFGTLNARQGEEALQHYRFNDPVGGIITFNLPTIGYEKPIFKYVSRRSPQSARAQIVSYSLNGTDFQRLDSLVITEEPTLYSFDFSSIAGSNDNPNFKFRIEFVQVAGNGAGNNRFDNVTLDATPLGGGDIVPPTVSFSPANNAMNIGLDQSVRMEFNEKIRLVSGKTFEDAFIFKKNNSTGSDVNFNASFINDSTIVVTPTGGLEYGIAYYFEINSNVIEDLSGNQFTTKSFISFRTISESGIIAPGSIVPIAIQTNTSPSTPDRIAILFLTDVSQGTAIQVTDAKFTSSTGQCAGGFTWFAPEGGIK
ncbi:MAG: Ig-like domain-containing protein, partial [Cytophagales bacterium]